MWPGGRVRSGSRRWANGKFSTQEKLMPTWTQVYDPLGHWWLSALVAALPIIVLFTLMAGLRVKPHWSALAGALTAVLVGVLVFKMPLSLAGGSFLYGVSTGLLNIVWIAIAAAFMIGLGFKPFHAAALNLIANTAPVAWGAIGTPVHMLAQVTAGGCPAVVTAAVVATCTPEADMNAMIGRILPITAIIVPFWLVRAMVGWKETFEVLPAILVVGVSFASMQFFWSNHVDSNLVDITAGLFSLLCTVLFLLFWKPKKIWRFAEDPADSSASGSASHNYTKSQVFRAWVPFLILSLFVFLWGYKPVKDWMNVHTTPAWVTAEGEPNGGWNTPLHRMISRDKPVVPKPTPEGAKFPFIWLSATGTGCFLAAIVGGLIRGVSLANLMKIFGRTLVRMRFAVLAISGMLGLGFVTRYSGTDAVLGLAFTHTGWFFPFFGTFLGWLGVALTGSDTSSNALFGSLQRITAEQLRLDP